MAGSSAGRDSSAVAVGVERVEGGVQSLPSTPVRFVVGLGCHRRDQLLEGLVGRDFDTKTGGPMVDPAKGACVAEYVDDQMQLAAIIAPSFTGAIIDLFGMRAMFVMCAVFFAFAFVTMGFVTSGEKDDKPIDLES